MNALDFNSITNKEVDSYNDLLECDQEIRRLQSDKINGETKENRESRREYIKSSKEFKIYRQEIFNLINSYQKVLSSGALENISGINKEIEDGLSDIFKISEGVQDKIKSLIKIN